MANEQAEWAAKIREIPLTFGKLVAATPEAALRHRPAEGEWSPIEVVGHIADKMEWWAERVERITTEDAPELEGKDQDAAVRDHAYQQADPQTLLQKLTDSSESFAKLVESLPNPALDLQGHHRGMKAMLTIRQCIEMPLGSIHEHLLQFQEAAAL